MSFEKINSDGKYVDLPSAIFRSRVKEIIDYWNLFVQEHDNTLELDKNYYIHERNLFEVIKRVDKRQAYYYVFHDIEEICEFKYIAITCYWLCTLHPFVVTNKNSIIYNSPNEMFSLYIIIAVMSKIFSEKHPHDKFIYPSDREIKGIIYNFKYCDLSREAFIFFVETYASKYGIGLDILKIAEKDLSDTATI